MGESWEGVCRKSVFWCANLELFVGVGIKKAYVRVCACVFVCVCKYGGDGRT